MPYDHPVLIVPKIPSWAYQYLPQSFRPAPPPPPPLLIAPKPEPSMWSSFGPIAAALIFLCVFAVVWNRYGLSFRCIYNRLTTRIKSAKSQAMLTLLRRRLTTAYEEERKAFKKASNTTVANGGRMVDGVLQPATSPSPALSPGLTSPAMVTVQHPDTMLQEFYGFRAVLNAQKESMKLDQKDMSAGLSNGSRSVAIAAADAALKLPNAGAIVDLLLSGIPTARRSIPLWMPATQADDGYYLTSLALPSSMINMMLVRQAHLPAAFLQAARLGASYHSICRYRESRAGEVRSVTNRKGYASHNSNDRYDRALQDLWSVAQCPELFSRLGAQWQQLGFTSNDPIHDLHDGNLYALDDLAHFARVHPSTHRHMLKYMAAKQKHAKRLSLSGLMDTFSEAWASFFISVMLTRLPKAFVGVEEENWLDAGSILDDNNADDDAAEMKEGGGEVASPNVLEETMDTFEADAKLKDGTPSKSSMKESTSASFAPTNRDGSCLHFTPTMIRFLYGGAAAVSMLATEDKAFAQMPRGKLSTTPTADDERVMRHRLRQLHSCLLRAYFDLWKREEPLSRDMFLLGTFYPESGRIADGYLRALLA